MRPNIQADFEDKCIGQKNCQFSVLATYQPNPKCVVEKEPHFIVAVECGKENIDLPGGGTISRQSLAIMACTFDLLICLWVIINISLYDVFINREDTFVDDKYL